MTKGVGFVTPEWQGESLATRKAQRILTEEEKVKTKMLTWLSKLIACLRFGQTSDENRSQTGANSGKHLASPKMGVFIDFDNINADAISLVLKHLSPQWDLTCRRAYGSAMAKHKGAFHSNGILAVEVLQNTPGVDPSQWPVPERKRPGPKPAHTGMLLHDRDELIQMLEFFWPEFEPLCHPKPNETGLKRVLTAILPQMQGRYEFPARNLRKHLPELVKFQFGDRFRCDPRQIANAFAGAPTLSTWRSLKLCQQQPCLAPIGARAIRAYIRRKHPDLHGRLSADDSLVNFVTALRSYQTKDDRLTRLVPQYLHASWKQGMAHSAGH